METNTPGNEEKEPGVPATEGADVSPSQAPAPAPAPAEKKSPGGGAANFIVEVFDDVLGKYFGVDKNRTEPSWRVIITACLAMVVMVWWAYSDWGGHVAYQNATEREEVVAHRKDVVTTCLKDNSDCKHWPVYEYNFGGKKHTYRGTSVKTSTDRVPDFDLTQTHGSYKNSKGEWVLVKRKSLLLYTLVELFVFAGSLFFLVRELKKKRAPKQGAGDS